MDTKELEKIIKQVITCKGLPWSQTEFNAVLKWARDKLKEKGATAEQLAYFEKKINDASLRGGAFNPWSGD